MFKLHCGGFSAIIYSKMQLTLKQKSFLSTLSRIMNKRGKQGNCKPQGFIFDAVLNITKAQKETEFTSS